MKQLTKNISQGILDMMAIIVILVCSKLLEFLCRNVPAVNHLLPIKCSREIMYTTVA